MRLWTTAALLALAGCAAPRSDLSAPCVWRELDAAPVAVAQGDRLLSIVTSDVPQNRWAAMFLAGAIEETCGRRPDVVVEGKGQRSTLAEGLFVGDVTANAGWESANAGKSPAAFRVVASDGCVRFLGRADFAVFDWCERALGLRFYGPAGRCAEKRPEIVVPAVDYEDRPLFEYRSFDGRNDPWLRVAKMGVEHRGGVAVHQPSRWFADKAVKAEHPRIFETGETPMLCYGNPETLDYYKRRIDRHLAGIEDSGGIVDTRRKVVTVSPWDAPVRCRCRHCRRLYDPGLGRRGAASPIVWGRFLRGLSGWLAVAHPDYLVSFLPYLNVCRVPRGLVLSDNTEAEVCTMPGLAMLKNERCREEEEDCLRDWRRVTGRKVLSWHYGCWPKDWTSAPYVFGRTIQRHCADMVDVSCGSYVCGGGDDARLALSMYVWTRCLWNPDLDLEALYGEFARRMFGPAEKPMRELITLQEACWNRQWEDDRCSFRNIFEVSFPRTDVERLKALLQESYALALKAKDAVSAQRIRWYASGMTDFFDESDALAGRTGCLAMRPGERREMVLARSARRPQPWAKTTVETRVERDVLTFLVRCEDPAADRMPFVREADDFVWGNDCVTFVLQGAGGQNTTRVYVDGSRDDGTADAPPESEKPVVCSSWKGVSVRLPRAETEDLSTRVSHDGTGWRVEASLRLSPEDIARGRVFGNVCRWRVGDRRMPEKRRVRGSRYEQSRLDTCYTNLDDDPAAFVEFMLR